MWSRVTVGHMGEGTLGRQLLSGTFFYGVQEKEESFLEGVYSELGSLF